MGDGDKINLQLVQLPPPTMSTTIIAALEIKYPDNEQHKNSLCQAIPIPQMPEDYLKALQVNNDVNKAVMKELGMRYFLKRRCFIFHHVSFLEMIKTLWKLRRMGPEMERKFELWFNEEK